MPNFISKAATHFRNILYIRKLKKIHAEHRKKYLVEYRQYDSIINTYRSTGGLKHDFQAYKLFSLFNLLQIEKPKSILELGTGTSTVIFADYVRQHDNVSLISVDESEQWLQSVKKLARIEENEKNITLIHASRNVILQDNRKEIRYDFTADKEFDFVFIDGPSMVVNDVKRKDMVNSDIFDIVRKSAPEIIVVDIRQNTAMEIKKRFETMYMCNMSDVIKKKSKSNYQYFSIFKKK